VKVLKGFSLPSQGLYLEGTEVTLYFGAVAGIGVLDQTLYEKLLKRGSIQPIEREVSDASI